MSTEKINETLKKNAFRNFIFFIPKLLIDTSNPNFKDELEYLLNKVIFLDNDLLDNLPDKTSSKDYKLNEDFIEKNLLRKRESFEKNMVYLLDEKENLPKSRFQYILNNYHEFIEAGVAWCELQNGLINSPIAPTLSETIKNTFLIQHNYFKKHCSELERTFKIKKGGDNSNALQAFIMDLYTLCEKNDANVTTPIKEDGSITTNDNPVITSDSNEVDENDDKAKKTLAHYILHEDNKKIEKVIFDNFKGKKGKKLRCIIEYLVRTNVTTLEPGNQQQIFNAFKNLFDHDIGVYQSMFGYEVDKTKDKTYSAVRLKFVKLLKAENIDL